MKADNIIFTEDGAVGTYEYMKKYIKEVINEYISTEFYEGISDLAELLQDLMQYKNDEHLLLWSMNNGMGQTITRLVRENEQ